jgi:hypothetical protein
MNFYKKLQRKTFFLIIKQIKLKMSNKENLFKFYFFFKENWRKKNLPRNFIEENRCFYEIWLFNRFVLKKKFGQYF